MEIQAAVLRRRGDPFVQEKLRLDELRANEVLVRLVATGICSSDIAVMRGLYPPPPRPFSARA